MAGGDERLTPEEYGEMSLAAVVIHLQTDHRRDGVIQGWKDAVLRLRFMAGMTFAVGEDEKAGMIRAVAVELEGYIREEVDLRRSYEKNHHLDMLWNEIQVRSEVLEAANAEVSETE